MPDIIRRHDNKNVPIIPLGSHNTSLTYFNLLELRKGQSYQFCAPNVECVCVVLSGNCDVRVDSHVFKDVGRRNDIWSGRADSGLCSERQQRRNTGQTATTPKWQSPAAIAQPLMSLSVSPRMNK